MTEDTLPKILLRNYRTYGDNDVAMRQKGYGIWNEYTHKESYETVKYLALGLLSVGFESGDKVSIIAECSPEWYWAEYAVQSIGGVPAGIDPDSASSEVKYVLERSDSKFAFADHQEQCDKLLEVKTNLPLLKKVIYWGPKEHWLYDNPILMHFDDLIDLGKKYEVEHPDLFEESVTMGKGNDLAVLCCTSGITGIPKVVMISHKALIEGAEALRVSYACRKTDNYVSNISPAMIGEQVFGVTACLLYITTVNFPEGPETAQNDIREIGPEFILYLSKQWESLGALVQAKIADTGKMRRFLYHLFLHIGYQVADLYMNKNNPNIFFKAVYWLGNMIIFRQIRDKLGLMKIKTAFTTGTGVSPDLIRFFHAIGVNLKQVYLITEAGVVSCHHEGDVKFETCGLPNNRTELKFSSEGQLIVKTPSMFEGYYKDTETTQDKLRDDWFYTDDVGRIDNNGHLVILGRLDELITLSDGSKFPPQYIETRLRFSPHIKEAIAIGKEYISILINIDFANVGKWARSNGIAYTTFTDLSQRSELAELIRQDIDMLNKTLPKDARIRKYVVMHKDFDPDEGELTRTGKLRRHFIEERHNQLIEAIYSEQVEYETYDSVKYRDGRTGQVVSSIEIRTIDIN